MHELHVHLHRHVYQSLGINPGSCVTCSHWLISLEWPPGDSLLNEWMLALIPPHVQQSCSSGFSFSTSNMSEKVGMSERKESELAR